MTVAPRALFAPAIIGPRHGRADRRSVEIPSRAWGDVIRSAVLTSLVRQRPILALLPFTADLGSLWRLARQSGEATIAWQGAGEEAAYLGLGCAWSLQAQAPADVPDLFDRVESALSEAARITREHGVAGDLVRAYGGMAFDPAGEHLAGSDVPLAAFTVPEIALCQRPGGRTIGAVAVRVEPGQQAPEIERRARQSLIRLQQASGCEAPEAAGSWVMADPEAGREAFEAAVERALLAIGDGQVDKVVLSRDVVLSGDNGTWGSAFERFAIAAPNTARYAVTLGPGDVYFGASPERLVALVDGRVRCDCLAGTLLPEDPDTAGSKERREHDVVAKALLAVLTPLCDAIELPSEPVWRPAPGLVHLWSPLSAQLKPGITIKDVVLALHPTPAVGGWPRDRALVLIRELEGRQRGWYAGAVGWMGPNEADFAVAIRGIRWKSNRATLTVGAGIVPGSTPAGEWLETRRKAEAVLALLERGQ